MIQALSARCELLSLKIDSQNGKPNLSYLLNILLETAAKNRDKNVHGLRYSEDVRMFAMYLFIVGGRMIYEFLCQNFDHAIPSISSVEKIIKASSGFVKEGSFCFSELKEFLVSRNLPLKVWISEDGTRINQRFEFDASTNQIIGPVLPLNDNGIPMCDSFPANSAAMIAHHFEKGKPSSSAYAIMAQPLQDGAPAFCLAIFGTDNRFISENVYHRWNYISAELKKIGVDVLGYSSDGDPKLLSAMHRQMFAKNNLGFFKEEWKEWFYACAGNNYVVVQDIIHLANKLRTRLNPSILMPIGKYVISDTHLKILMDTVAKEEHGLTMSHLGKVDKMNFNASILVSRERTTALLEKHVPGSEGTQAYLNVMRNVIESFLNKELSASERIYKIWHSLFFFRYWKLWLLSQARYSLSNFISSNAYVCMEIVAHALIILIIKLRDERLPALLLFHLFSSQACESFFRMARSMTSTFSTVINFSMKEFLYKIKRIHILLDVSSKLSEKLTFPRDKRKHLLSTFTEKQLNQDYLPNNEDILMIVQNARSDAVSTLQKLGIKCGSLRLASLSSKLISAKNFDDDEYDKEEDTPTETYEAASLQDFSEEDDIPLDILAAFPSPNSVPSLDFEDAHPTVQSIPSDSIYVHVRKADGLFAPLRKSTLCWLLSTEGSKLSNDRNVRVRNNILLTYGKLSIGQKKDVLERNTDIKIGEWCIFKKSSKKEAHLVGQVLSFSYLTGSGAARAYTLPQAPVEPPETKKGATKGIGCLCSWFQVNAKGELTQSNSAIHEYISIKNYVKSIPHPTPEKSSGVLIVSQNTKLFFDTL